VSLSAELFEHFEHVIEALTLIPSDGGRFEVSLNGQLIYSKLQTKRHAEAGEIVNLISKIVEG
jgi:selenoprotein W-related protein